MKYHAARLSAIPVRLNIPPLKDLIKTPGMNTLYRLTIYYVDGRAYNVVATLYDKTTDYDKRLEVVHEGLFENQARIFSVSERNYEKLQDAFTQNRFDTLGDMPDADHASKTMWLLEQLSGGFYHGVVLSPHQSLKRYTGIINAVDAYLPDAIREIERT